MTKAPASKIAIALYVVAFFFACGCGLALYESIQQTGNTRQATTVKIAMLEAVRHSGITALSAFVWGHVVQMIADIRWKLFEGSANA